MNRHFFCFVAATLVLTACSDTKTYTDSEGNKVDVTQKGDRDSVDMNISSKDGNMKIKAGDAVDADAALPYDLPMIDGAEVGAQMSSSGDKGEKGAMVTFTTRKSPDEVLAFYKDALTDAGFKVENEASMNEMRMVSGKRGEKEGVAVTITKGEGDDAGKTSVLVLAGME